MGRARVDRDDDAVFVDEGEGRGAVVGLDVIDNLALELIVLCDRRVGWVVTVRSRGRSNGRGATLEINLTLRASGRRGDRVGRMETHVLYLGQLEVLRVDVALDLTRAVWSDGSEVRRQWVSERRGDGEMAVTTRTAVFVRSQPCEGRGGGRTTHKSASILSVARCGASSTE